MYSQQLSSFYKKAKKSDIDQAQKAISSITKQMFSDKRESGSVETDSITHIPIKSDKKLKTIPIRIDGETLIDIENKMKSINNEAATAIKDKDMNQLHFLLKSVETLVTDLQLINFYPSSPQNTKKNAIEKSLLRLYHKIDKNRKQIGRADNIEYLTQLQEKDKTQKDLKELDEIRNSVIGITVPDLIQESDVQNFASLREKLKIYRSKITSIQENNAEVRDRKSQISDLISNHEKEFTKVEVRNKLQQAEEALGKFLPELEKFPYCSDSEAYQKTKKYLVDLRSYVNKIPEVDNTTISRKEEFFRDLEKCGDILETKVKLNDGENKSGGVVLRNRTPEPSRFEFLTACCLKIQEMNLVEYSGESKSKVYENLLKLKSVIERKLEDFSSQSVTSETNSDILKVNVKMNDLPEVSSIKKPIEAKDLKQIREEMHKIEDEIAANSYTQNYEQYKLLKSKLDSAKKQIRRLSFYGNEAARNSTSDLLKYIDNISDKLETKTSLSLQRKKGNRRSTEHILNDVMSISTRVSDIGERITGTNSLTKEDYNYIKNSLLEHKDYLSNLNVTTYSKNIGKSRDEILHQIDCYLVQLEDSWENNETKTLSKEELEFNEHYNGLKEKLSRFTGTYRNVLYKKLEADFKQCLLDVDKKIKDKHVADRLKQEIRGNLDVLEQKSIKDRTYIKNVEPESDIVKLRRIKEEIGNIKKELKGYKTMEQFELLDGRLTLSILALDNLTVSEDLAEEKSILYKEVEKHLTYVNEQMTTTINQPVQRPQEISSRRPAPLLWKQRSDAEEIDNISQQLQALEPEISAFIGSESDDQFLKLDEILIQNTLKLDGLKLQPGTDLYGLKLDLLKLIQNYSETLDQNIKETEQIEETEKSVREMCMKVDLFSGVYTDPEYDILDEQLINLKLKTVKLNLGEHLQARKNACLKEIDESMRKLDAIARNRGSISSGTLV